MPSNDLDCFEGLTLWERERKRGNRKGRGGGGGREGPKVCEKSKKREECEPNVAFWQEKEKKKKSIKKKTSPWS